MMDKENYYEKIIYLNKSRIEVINSKEFFWGKKLCKYVDFIKKCHFITIIKHLCHDIYALLKKNVSKNEIIDFEKDAIKEFGNKIVVYTCIFGNYDDILEPLYYDENCDYYIFTDQEIPVNSIWKKADCSKIPKECNTPALKNRYVKMFPNRFFDTDYSIYIDGNLQIVGKVSLLLQKRINTNKTGISMHLSPRENCIYEEARNVFFVGKINQKEKNEMLILYKKNKMPKHFGMFECNVIVRNHHNKNCNTIMEKWWNYYSNGVKRDQLYFTLVLHEMNYQFSDVLNFGASVNQNFYFLRKEHI